MNKILIGVAVCLALSSCAEIEKNFGADIDKAKADIKKAVSHIRKTKIVNDPKFKADWAQAKEGFTSLLASLDLENYFYQFAGQAEKRFIRVNKDNREVYSKSNNEVNISTERERSFQGIIDAASERYDVPTARIYAVIRAESGFNAKALSPAGAQGLMQLMPATAKSLGVKNAFNAKQNVEGGTKYLSALYHQYDDWTLAHAAYNAGPGNVNKYGRKVPPFKETRQYVKRVEKYYSYYRYKV